MGTHCTTVRYGDAAAVGDYLARNFRAYKPGAPLRKLEKFRPTLLDTGTVVHSPFRLRDFCWKNRRLFWFVCSVRKCSEQFAK